MIPDFNPPERCLIGGDWIGTRDTLAVEDPSEGVVFARIARGGPAEIASAVEAAEWALASDWGRANGPYECAPR
jgi:aldehyde dehydrogenase (NAD+)